MGIEIKRELSVWADFNSVDALRRIKASLRFASGAERPRKGELVRLYDDEGNSVIGVVEEIHDLIVHVRPDMATWSSAGISIVWTFPGDAPFSVTVGEPQVEQVP